MKVNLSPPPLTILLASPKVSTVFSLSYILPDLSLLHLQTKLYYSLKISIHTFYDFIFCLNNKYIMNIFHISAYKSTLFFLTDALQFVCLYFNVSISILLTIPFIDTYLDVPKISYYK